MHVQAMQGVSVAKLLAEFNTDHPAVEISVRHVANPPRWPIRSVTAALDLAFISLTNEQPPGLVLTRLAGEVMMVATGPRHRLAGRKEIDLTTHIRFGIDLPAALALPPSYVHTTSCWIRHRDPPVGPSSGSSNPLVAQGQYG
jgi:DNA-binding transcriptional LysR family regulator